MKNKKFKAGDAVRVKQSGGKPGPTRWIVDSIAATGACWIREDLGTRQGSAQRFDTSLLVHDLEPVKVKCPRCKRESEVPPGCVANCGACLMDHVEIVVLQRVM